MEYKEEFTVKGKYGMHVGPNCRIANLIIDKKVELFNEDKDLEVIIVKSYCSEKLSSKEIADASNARELLSLCMSEGSKLEVIATLKPENSGEEYKKELKKL